MTSRMRLIFGALALAAGMAGCATLDTWQRKAIFQHQRAAVDARFAGSAPPPATEAFDLRLANGDIVHAWYRQAAAEAPTVLFLHGARRNLYESRYRIDRLAELGLNVLAIDYRGFGHSTPILPSEETALHDGRAAFDELRRRQPDPRRRFLYGYSLGGAVAIALAAEHDGFAGVIVESSFTSITDLVRASRWGWVPFLGAVVTQEFDSRTRIGRVNEPRGIRISAIRTGPCPAPPLRRTASRARHSSLDSRPPRPRSTSGTPRAVPAARAPAGAR